jgi:hypothetical protein
MSHEYSKVQLYCSFAFLCSAGNQSAELTGIRKFPISSNKSGQQQQIWSNSEILLAQISVCLRFLAWMHVFEAAEIQIRQQILYPCLLLDSGLRDYEIKLNQRLAPILKLRQKQRICKTVLEQRLTLRAILAQNSAETAIGRASGENRSKFNCQLVVNRR